MKVEIWSDVVCPWCYIGKRRFEAALARFEHRDAVDVVWRSFELDRRAPRAGGADLTEHLAAKYGTSLEQARQMQEHMTAAAAGEGLAYRFDLARTANTFDAHRLLHLAADRGADVQDAVKERLLAGYFTEGACIDDRDTLVRLGADAGVDAPDARAVLDGDAYAEAVRRDERDAAALGIRGVPFFVVDRAYGVSGAQPADVLLEALQTAWAESHPLTLVAGTGAGAGAGECADGNCAV